MAFFIRKPNIIEAITFDELTEYGLKNSESVPLSFNYKGHYIVYSDDCYLIPTLDGTMKMLKTDMLITGMAGEIYPCKDYIFNHLYERIEK